MVATSDRYVHAVEDVSDVVEDGGGDLGHAHGAGGFYEIVLSGAELTGALRNLLLHRAMALFEQGLAAGDVGHFSDALAAGKDEEDVFEDDPAGVLDPAPAADGFESVNRLWHVDYAGEMVGGDDGGGGDQDAPIAVEREECERAEDVKVHFDAAAVEVDEEGGKEDLGDGDDVAGEDFAGAAPDEREREEDYDAEQKCCPDMGMDCADGAVPGAGGNREGEDDGGHPFEDEEAGEEAVGANPNLALVDV